MITSDPNTPPACWPVRPGVNGRSAAPATARRIPSCARGVEKPRPLAARAAKFLGGRKDPRDAERLCVNHLVTTDRNKSSRARATSKGSQHIAPRPRDMRNGSGNAGRTQSTTYANSRPSCVHCQSLATGRPARGALRHWKLELRGIHPGVGYRPPALSRIKNAWTVPACRPGRCSCFDSFPPVAVHPPTTLSCID
jgi:hypothetical protein